MEKATILVVDDFTPIREFIVTVLRDFNPDYKFVEAGTGGDACRLAVSKLPDLIILDWILPDMTGIEVIACVKKNHLLADVPVIIESGTKISSEDLQLALEHGAVDYMRKPIEQPELIARVRNSFKLAESAQKIKAQNKDLELQKSEIETYKSHLERLVARRTEDLKECEQRYKTVFNSVSQGIMVFSSSKKIRHANPYACEVLGFNDKEIRKLIPAEFIHVDSHRIFFEMIDTINSRDDFKGKIIFCGKNRQKLPAQVFGSSLYFGGQLHYYVLFSLLVS